jgi:hypothetical protein
MTPAMMSLSRESPGFGDDDGGKGRGGGWDGGDGRTFRSGDEGREDVPGVARGAPHLLQKFFPGVISVPHASQNGIFLPWHNKNINLFSVFRIYSCVPVTKNSFFTIASHPEHQLSPHVIPLTIRDFLWFFRRCNYY